MEPIYENIQPNIGSSFYMHVSQPGCCEPFWHIHPEYELVYIKSGSTKRHVGSNISSYYDGDLLLIGSNIPHSNLGNQDHSDNIEIVVQIGIDFITHFIHPFPEFMAIKLLMQQSDKGISFGKKIKEQVGVMLQSMANQLPFKKLWTLMEVLQLLAETKDYTLLNAKAASIEVQSNDYERVNRINQFVSNNYHRQLPLYELSQLTGLTETSFSRFFKKVTGKTFVTFLNEYRIQKACAMLGDKTTSIADVMLQSGFIEPAYFARIFKRYTNYSPREYRNMLRER